MAANTPIQVIGKDGLQGTIRNLPPSGTAEIELSTGQRLFVPVSLLCKSPDGTYTIPLGLANTSAAQPGPHEAIDESPHAGSGEGAGQSVTVPVVAEQLRLSKQQHETGKTVVHIVPETHSEHVRMPLAEEHAQIERIEVNEFVTSPRPVREEGDVTIIPVYDEVLVVERRLLLREEIRIHRQRVTRDEEHDIPLRSEQVHILRSQPPADSPPAAAL